MNNTDKKQQKLTESISKIKNETHEFIDVKELINQLSVEELCLAAEEYFARLTNWDYHLSKPFGSVDESREVLTMFAHVLPGLQLSPGMKVLDFGAGSCWTSRYLTQLGLEVIALDVSASVLKIGQELFARQPVIGNKPSPQFLHFNGQIIDLPDNSVDRILCFESFHHVPNPEQVMKEFCRVLKQGGIAGFSEPGPNHSRSIQSQYEMRSFTVIENDIDVHTIWSYAQKIGFTKIELAIFNELPVRVSLEEFEDFFSGTRTKERYIESTRCSMTNHRSFFMYKGELEFGDSRQLKGLSAQLSIDIPEKSVKEGTPFFATATVTNTGNLVWLPTTAGVGGVNLGVHLLDQSGQQINYDYFRQPLSPFGENKSIQPKETLNFEMQMSPLIKGRYILEFDLVSEGVGWFAANGSKTLKFNVEVI